MVNATLIKEKAKSMGLRQRNIADALGIKQSTVNQKINNVRPMLLDEAEKIASLLNISDDEFAKYFFNSEVAQCNNERIADGVNA